VRSDRKFPLLAQFLKHPGFSEKGRADEQDKHMDVLRNPSKIHRSLQAASLGEARAILSVLELIHRPCCSICSGALPFTG